MSRLFTSLKEKSKDNMMILCLWKYSVFVVMFMCLFVCLVFASSVGLQMPLGVLGCVGYISKEVSWEEGAL